MEHTVSVQSLKFSYSLYIPVKENKNVLRNVLPMDRKRNVCWLWNQNGNMKPNIEANEETDDGHDIILFNYLCLEFFPIFSTEVQGVVKDSKKILFFWWS